MQQEDSYRPLLRGGPHVSKISCELLGRVVVSESRPEQMLTLTDDVTLAFLSVMRAICKQDPNKAAQVLVMSPKNVFTSISAVLISRRNGERLVNLCCCWYFSPGGEVSSCWLVLPSSVRLSAAASSRALQRFVGLNAELAAHS